MRDTLEQNPAFQMDLKSGRLGTVSRILVGDVTIPSDTALLHFYNPGGSNRNITLPAFGEGRFAIIFNTGTGNTLTVKDSNGTEVAVIYPLHSVQFYSSETAWYSIGHVFGLAGTTHRPGVVPDPGSTSHPLADDKLYLREDGWAQVTELTGDDFVKFITDGTNILTPVGAGTVKFHSTDGSISVVATNDDVTHGDNVNFAVIEAQVDHNLLGNYVANQHIDHTAVSISTTANSGLAGGGTIAATRSISLDVNNLATIVPVLADYLPFYDVSGVVSGKALVSTFNGILDHNALLNFVANKHIDHTTVSISAGTGLTGGGDISASRTISLDFNGLSADTLAAGDFFAFYDISGADHNKITFSNLNTSLDHNVLLNYSANQHIDHTAVSITGTGALGGGGTIAASRTISLNANGVTFAFFQQIATDRLLGRDTAATGNVEELTVGGGIEFTGSGGIQTSARTGDVTKTAGGTVLTIANDAVTFAKMQNLTTDRLLGRDTAGTGDPEEISVGGGIEFTGGPGIQRSALTGDVTAAAGSGATVALQASTTWNWTGITSPAQITANQNNYALVANKVIYRVSTDAARDMTGLAAGTDGQLVIFFNIGASFDLTFKNENASSTAANRFALSADITISAFQSAAFVYDGTSARWRPFGGAGSSAGGGAPTTAQYVTLATDGTLSQERVLTAGSGITLTDAGAGSTLTAAVVFAAQADMEAASSAVKAVPPSLQHQHPGHPKTTASWTWALGAATASVSAVDFTTNERITITGHGLTSGDAVLTGSAWNVGGSSPSTMYFVSVFDANNFHLHLTYASAIAVTGKVNLTSAGTGTRTVQKVTVTINHSFGLTASAPIIVPVAGQPTLAWTINLLTAYSTTAKMYGMCSLEDGGAIGVLIATSTSVFTTGNGGTIGIGGSAGTLNQMFAFGDQ